MAPRILLTEPLPEEAVGMLENHGEVVRGFGVSAVHIGDVIEEVDAVLIRRKQLNGEQIRRAKNLKVISRFGVGYDNIDVDAATARGIPVLITADANRRSVAEHVFGAALALVRNLVSWDADVRRGLFESRDQRLGHDLSGRTLGIIGLGRIGAEVARIGRVAFDMPSIAHHPRLSVEQIRARGAEPAADLEEVLRRSDVVTVHVPLRPESQHLISRGELSVMQPDALLINVARGGVVDEVALADAVQNEVIAGAAVDVYADEPPSHGNPLLGVERILLTPHTAAHTHEAFARMARHAAEGLLDVLTGRRPSNILNPACLARGEGAGQR